MSERFVQSATRLAGFAGVILGWPPEVFWQATPAELATVVFALHGGEAATPPDQRTIARLQEEFPDG